MESVDWDDEDDDMKEDALRDAYVKSSKAAF